VRYAVRHLNYDACRAMTEKALQAEDSYTIRALSQDLARASYAELFD